MEFIYDYVGMPKNYELLVKINSAAGRLFNKLRGFNVNSLVISDYNKKYFGDKLRSLKAVLQLNSYILAWSLAKAGIPLNEFVFLDYGGGSGMLSLLAKELGIGTVIYNDIYDVSCEDAKVIGGAVGNQADYYVHGDIDDVLRFLKENCISCDAIASYDVIEHIYKIEEFLGKLGLLSDGRMSVVLASGANNFNPLIRNKSIKKQLEVEFEGREKKWGHKKRDCLRPYLKVREEIILKYSSNLTKEEVKQLAKLTRGLIESDIIKHVDKYLEIGEFPVEPGHPTNTCDPHTGNWMECLMDPGKLKGILSGKGFEVKILAGYYGHSRSIFKRLIVRLLNTAIKLLGKKQLLIAPFFTLYGTRDSFRA